MGFWRRVDINRCGEREVLKRMEHLSVDAVYLWHQMQHHENELWHKRKYLMGLSEMYSCQNGRLCAVKQSIMPESILRKDDVFYDDVKNFVEKSFLQAFDTDSTQSMIDEEEESCEIHNVSNFILTLLDDLSNKGMCRLAKIVTRGSFIYGKTRPQMKRVIKDSLQEIHSHWLDSNFKGKMQNELFQLVKNPRNFCQNHGKHTKLTRKYLDRAFKNLQLQSFPVRILYPMYRRLKGIQGVMPQLRPCHSGWSRDRLCEQVQKLWVKMIDQLDKSNKVLDPLVKAMEVPFLYSKIASKSQDLSMYKFVLVPPEMEALQNEIVRAIKSLRQRRFKKEELKQLQLLLDRESKVDVNGLRRAINNMLIDCLLVCSEMEAVPDSLIDALSLINKKPRIKHVVFLKEVIEEEVECILNASAHMKQLMWDCAPVDKLDQDFVDAYMEDLVESDDGDIFDDDDHQLHTKSLDEVQIRFNDFSEEIASTGDAEPASFSSPTSDYKDKSGNSDEFTSSPSFRAASFVGENECKDTEINGHEMQSTVSGDVSYPLVSPPLLHDNGDVIGRPDLINIATVTFVNLVENGSTENLMSEDQRNHYVAIQEVCDQAALGAYQIIGQVLADFGQMESLDLNSESETYLRGDFAQSKKFQGSVAGAKDNDMSGSIIVQAVHKVIPTFPNSQLEMVKNFMNS